MNSPPLPTNPSTKCTRRPEENLTSLAPGLRGAVLLPVIPKIPQSQSWILVKRTDVFGEGGKNFILHHFLLEVLHPPHRPNRGKQIQLVNRDARKHRKINHQNGREQLCRTSGEPVIAYAVHPGVLLRVHLTARSITVKPKRFARYSGWFTHIAKAPSWAGATPLCCHGNRGGRSSPIEVHRYKSCL